MTKNGSKSYWPLCLFQFCQKLHHGWGQQSIKSRPYCSHLPGKRTNMIVIIVILVSILVSRTPECLPYPSPLLLPMVAFAADQSQALNTNITHT